MTVAVAVVAMAVVVVIVVAAVAVVAVDICCCHCCFGIFSLFLYLDFSRHVITTTEANALPYPKSVAFHFLFCSLFSSLSFLVFPPLSLSPHFPPSAAKMRSKCLKIIKFIWHRYVYLYYSDLGG